MDNLWVDGNYYNTLDIEGFSKMMKNPAFCYKFYWLEALVHLILNDQQEATYDEIINEMVSNAWYSVLEFHIHLSGIYGDGLIKDNLEKAVLRLQELSSLPANATKIQIHNAIQEFYQDGEFRKSKLELTKNVPVKALSGFANRHSAQIDLNASAGRMMAYYNQLNEQSILLPYTFGTDSGLSRKLYFGKAWIAMIQDHGVAILGWIQNEKIKWLQNNNPEVPGLVYKLAPMDERMRKLGNVRKLWKGIMELTPLEDVFQMELIDIDHYEVDHFIPWTFVMNDELWNLMPMDASLNSSKSNKLPAWSPFFPRFANNQYQMYQLIQKKNGIRSLYEACYRDNLHSIWAIQDLYRRGNERAEFYQILEKNMRPSYDSAKRQGYDLWNIQLDRSWI